MLDANACSPPLPRDAAAQALANAFAEFRVDGMSDAGEAHMAILNGLHTVLTRRAPSHETGPLHVPAEAPAEAGAGESDLSEGDLGQNEDEAGVRCECLVHRVFGLRYGQAPPEPALTEGLFFRVCAYHSRGSQGGKEGGER